MSAAGGLVRPTRRIGVELPVNLLERLEAQAELLGTSRQLLIESALMGLVREFEDIDESSGVVCPRCAAPTEVDEIAGSSRRVCVRCTWSTVAGP